MSKNFVSTESDIIQYLHYQQWLYPVTISCFYVCVPYYTVSEWEGMVTSYLILPLTTETGKQKEPNKCCWMNEWTNAYIHEGLNNSPASPCYSSDRHKNKAGAFIWDAYTGSAGELEAHTICRTLLLKDPVVRKAQVRGGQVQAPLSARPVWPS